ncbi:MAG: TetR family transcriptional regulator [Gemmatimonas sp.]|nr:TetR family transcriptional regulator [Gemmatimonas sp.]
MRLDRTPYDEKLDAILAASARVFAEKGYHNASIRDIARASGVSLSGLYYYFQSKEELLYLIQDHGLGTLLDRLEERLQRVVRPEDKLRVLIRNHLTYFVSNMAQMKVMSHEADSLTGEFKAQVNRKKRRFVDIAGEILNELNPNTDLDLRVSTFALYGMINWLYTWYRAERDPDADVLADTMTRIFIEGYRGNKVDPAMMSEAMLPS